MMKTSSLVFADKIAYLLLQCTFFYYVKQHLIFSASTANTKHRAEEKNSKCKVNYSMQPSFTHFCHTPMWGKKLRRLGYDPMRGPHLGVAVQP